MVTYLAQNEFIPNSVTPPSPAVTDTAAADQVAPQVAAAGTISVSDGALCSSLPAVEMESSVTETYAPSETEGAVSVSTASFDISDIPELFRVANYLCAQARVFTPDYPSIYQAMLDDNAPRVLPSDPVWADDAPLFLQRNAG